MRNLINIVSETPEQVRSEIDKKIQNIPDESDLTDILKFTNRYSIKKDVDAFTTLRNYKGLVSGVFLQALADAGIGETEVKKFLAKLSTDGILNEKKLLTPRVVHSYNDIIDPQYQTVFDSIKIDLFQKISGKIGEMGDVGKGEYLLDIISPLVNRRGAPGDLDITGLKIELKAGENGRLGPAGSMSLAGRFQREFLPVIQKLMPNKVDQIVSPTDFNLKQNMSYFSDFFETAPNIKTALTYMLGMHYPGYDVKSMVKVIVSKNGAIDGNVLKEQMLKASFENYKSAKEFDGVIIMDSAITKFLYINTGDDIIASASQLVVSFPSWTDQQSNCMKLTLAKGRSVKAVTAKAPAAPKKQPKSTPIAPVAEPVAAPAPVAAAPTPAPTAVPDQAAPAPAAEVPAAPVATRTPEPRTTASSPRARRT
jgi:hypothetical protein